MKKITGNNFNQNTYVVSVNGGVVIIDPGYNWEKILITVGTDNVLAVLLTHFHFDHVSYVNSVCARFEVKAYIHEKDYNYLLTDTLSSQFGMGKVTVDEKYIEKFNYFIPGFTDILAIHVPGHTQGSVAYKVRNMIFTGDLLFRDGVGRSDLVGGHPTMLQESLKQIMMQPGEMVICPGHGEIDYLKNIKNNNQFLPK